MEAATAGSAPAAATGEPNAQTGEAQEGGADVGQWQQSVDQQLAASNDAIRQMAENFQGFQQTLSERLPEPPAAPTFEDQFGEIFGELGQNGGYVEPQQIQQLQSLMQQQAQTVQQQVQQQVQEALAPIQQQMTAQQFQALQGKYGEFNDPKYVQQIADKTVDTAIAIAPQGMPPQFIEALTENADFLELVHLAETARRSAREETPAGQGQTVPHIESGGGAAPSSTGEADEWGSFLDSRKRGSVFG